MWRKFLLILFPGFLVAACSSDNPTCSGEDVLNQIRGIAAQQIGEDVNLKWIYSPKTSKYDINEITTTGKGDRFCTCSATLHYGFELLPGMTYTGNVTRFPRETSFNIEYKAQLTDDGKNVHVTAKGWPSVLARPSGF